MRETRIKQFTIRRAGGKFEAIIYRRALNAMGQRKNERMSTPLDGWEYRFNSLGEALGFDVRDITVVCHENGESFASGSKMKWGFWPVDVTRPISRELSNEIFRDFTRAFADVTHGHQRFLHDLRQQVPSCITVYGQGSTRVG